MSRGASVQIEGGEELLKRLRRLGIDVDQALGIAAQAAGAVVGDAAGAMAPGPHVVTGEVTVGRGHAEVEVGPDKAHWYYIFIETGAPPHPITGSPLAFEGREGPVITGRVSHPGMTATPFLRPAMDEQRGNAVKEFGQIIKKRARM